MPGWDCGAPASSAFRVFVARAGVVQGGASLQLGYGKSSSPYAGRSVKLAKVSNFRVERLCTAPGRSEGTFQLIGSHLLAIVTLTLQGMAWMLRV